MQNGRGGQIAGPHCPDAQLQPERGDHDTGHGASAIWDTAAAVHGPRLAATRSRSATIAGTTDWAAGLKNTAPADGDRIDRDDGAVHERQREREDGAGQANADHHPHSRQPVRQRTNKRRQQRYGDDLCDQHSGDSEAGPRQRVDQEC